MTRKHAKMGHTRKHPPTHTHKQSCNFCNKAFRNACMQLNNTRNNGEKKQCGNSSRWSGAKLRILLDSAGTPTHINKFSTMHIHLHRRFICTHTNKYEAPQSYVHVVVIANASAANSTSLSWYCRKSPRIHSTKKVSYANLILLIAYRLFASVAVITICACYICCYCLYLCLSP